MQCKPYHHAYNLLLVALNLTILSLHSCIQIRQVCRTSWQGHSVIGELCYKILTRCSVFTPFWRLPFFIPVWSGMFKKLLHLIIFMTVCMCVCVCAFTSCIILFCSLPISDTAGVWLCGGWPACHIFVNKIALAEVTAKVTGAGSHRREKASCFNTGHA